MALTVSLAAGVFRIPTAPRDLVNTFAFVDDQGVTLVDCGLASAPPRIVAGLAEIGKSPADVTRIILTHAHPDHAAGAARLKRQTGATVLLHDADAGYALAGKPPPPDQSRLSGRIVARLNHRSRFEPVESQPLRDGQLLDVGGGLRVLHTPGHSPGHVSLLHEPTGVLITGDAIFNVLGLRRSPAWLCTDVRLTERTAHVLGEQEYGVAAFTHGPEIRDRARERVRALLRRLGG